MQTTTEDRRYYDPQRLFALRYLLKDPTRPPVLTQNPHTKKWEATKGSLAHYLTDYCRAAGLSVGVNDFLLTRRRRCRVGQSHYTTVALMSRRRMLSMYTLVYEGKPSTAFVSLLHSLGWWAGSEQAKVPAHKQSTDQFDLFA